MKKTKTKQYSLIRISVPWQSISKWWFITNDGWIKPLRWLCNGNWCAIGLLISVIAIFQFGSLYFCACQFQFKWEILSLNSVVYAILLWNFLFTCRLSKQHCSKTYKMILLFQCDVRCGNIGRVGSFDSQRIFLAKGTGELSFVGFLHNQMNIHCMTLHLFFSPSINWEVWLFFFRRVLHEKTDNIFFI